MPDHRGFAGALKGLKLRLEQGLAAFDGSGLTVNVQVLDSTSLSTEAVDTLPTNTVGIYLHRIAVDPAGGNRNMPPPRRGLPRQAELLVNLHLLLIVLKAKLDAEATILGWAIQQMGSALEIDHSLLVTAEPEAQWDPADVLQVLPDAMNTEDLLRIWQGLPGDYHLSAPYVIRNLRVLPARLVEQGPIVGEVEHQMGRFE